MALQLTFLNTIDAPCMGPVETKRMRAHITKANFTKRRRRLVEERQRQKDSEVIHRRSSSQPNEQMCLTYGCALKQRNLPSSDLKADWPLMEMARQATASIAYLLHEFRPLVFPGGTGCPGSVAEVAFVHLLLSEPALVEACLAVGLKHSPKHQYVWTSHEAAIRKGRAIRMINQRLDATSALTDGLLSAVFTLTWAGDLEGDANAMEIHLQGLAQMIKLRRSAGDNSVPTWFSDFLLCDSLGKSVSSAHGVYKQLIQALRNDDMPTITDISLIRSGIDHLRQDIDSYQSALPRRAAEISIEYQIDCLRYEVDTLLDSPEHHIRTLRRSLQLFLLLLWPSKAPENLAVLAEDLRQALIEPHMRLCSAIELPIWQLSVGAVASEASVETNSWYRARLRELFDTLNARSLDVGWSSLHKTFMPDAKVLRQFELIWQETIGQAFLPLN